MSSRTRAFIALFVAVILGSTSGLLIKISGWDALALNGARSLIAAGVVWAYLRRPQFTWSGAQIGGAAAYALAITTFVVATRWTTAANAVFLQFTAPLWVALFSIWLLGERPKRSDWLTMAAVALGMLLFFGGALTPTGFWGNIVAIVSGMSLGMMYTALRMQRDGSPTETILLGNLIAAAVGLPFIFLNSQPFDAFNVSIVLFMGVLQLGLPFLLISLAIKEISAIETVLTQTLAPVTNSLFVYLGIGERPSGSALAGAIIITLAIVANAWGAARTTRPRPSRPPELPV
ncbi:MAG: DMT family transporter [Candidatus Promineifilaceae bacterium]|jgi:drug/metabolite transporter (DMT)-like permease